jgi:hypothetical protein
MYWAIQRFLVVYPPAVKVSHNDAANDTVNALVGRAQTYLLDCQTDDICLSISNNT